MKKKIVGIVLCAIIAFFSCNQPGKKESSKTAVNGTQTEDSTLNIARGFFKPLPLVADNIDNAVTVPKVQLGKVLYYDTRLSRTGNNSCNSCHNLQTFGVDNKATSTGDAGKQGNRNSPTVFNAALQNMQFWDGRAKDLEEQAGMPILNPVEMAIPHKGFLVDRLNKIQLYQEMFKAAFPGEAKPVTYENLQKAIGAFERTLLAPSRFDKYMQGDVNAITPTEKEGLKVFIASGCATCHNGVGVGGSSLQRFGLVTDYRTLTNSKVDDEGRKAVTKNDADKDVFKVPELRNAAGTYPYFHDGSIASLDSAVKIMGKAQLNKTLSNNEIKEIVAFLNSLSGDVNPDAKTMPSELIKK
ncbi:cytochrome-c peroxidase [Ginsengibacter hankyongi]|uniref:Methylamine utilization protein MauG n=1 Tax=Ginsengibacter hankyongi TaxID=2607284 RepID=A0A5J5II33_9BACT|nr:cytochrome-c peroxidase [Ginsengibacter hankyongi]KAA9039586.1 cytochrome-c peroxidase [Ginsengibacter hankyongi]